jgi:Ca2+-binding RTX toxin-like protein
VAGNTSSGPGPDIDGTITSSDGHNILGSGVAGTVAGDLFNIPAAQLFAGGLAENGGPTQTVALLGAAANPALFHGAGGPATDQRVEPRPAAAGTAPDAGAFELQQRPATVLGSARSETLTGTGAGDHLRGLGGDDRLLGRAEDDRLEGGDGDDRIVGGAGGDLLLGGGGADHFAFRAPGHNEAAAQDLIVDFSRHQGDRIDLRALDGHPREQGDQALDFVGRHRFEDAGEVRFRVDESHTVVDVNLDHDAAPELSFRLGHLVHLQEHDFLL